MNLSGLFNVFLHPQIWPDNTRCLSRKNSILLVGDLNSDYLGMQIISVTFNFVNVHETHLYLGGHYLHDIFEVLLKQIWEKAWQG